ALFVASAVIRRFWNVPRCMLPPEPADEPPAVSASLLLRSANDSKAAAIGLLLRLSDPLPLDVPPLPFPLDEPRSSESSRDWAPSTPGASCLVALSAVPAPDRPTKISFRILATCVAFALFRRKVRSVVPVVSDLSRRWTHCVVWASNLGFFVTTITAFMRE